MKFVTNGHHKMKPSDFYKEARAYKDGLTECVLCNLHMPCSTSGLCERRLNYKMLNFDEIKEYYCHVHKIGSCSSSDGLTFSPSDRSLFFVEIKSWLNVINSPHGKTEVTDAELQNKAEQYALAIKKKVSDSLNICRDIASDANEYDAIPKNIVLVTDIDTKTNPMALLVLNLNHLGATASNKQQFCNDAMNKSIIANNLSIHYWFCHDFDVNISKY